MFYLPRDATRVRPQPSGGVIEHAGEAALDGRGHVLKARSRTGLWQHLECVQRVLVTGGVDLGGSNIEGKFFEIAGDAREQSRLVARHHHHREACRFAVHCVAVTERTHPHHRVRGRRIAVKHRCVPRHFGRIKALKIAVSDMRPQRWFFVNTVALAIQRQRICTFVFNPVLVRHRITAQ